MKMAGLALILAACSPCAAPPAVPPAAVRTVPVLRAGAIAVGCLSPGPCKYAAFRIPGLIHTRNGTLIAVAEGRKNGCSDFAGQHDLVAGKHPAAMAAHHNLISMGRPIPTDCFAFSARSTDHGASWGESTVLFDANHSWPASKFKSEHSNAIWDPTPVFDSSTGETFIFFGGPGRTAKDSRLDVTAISSTDLGLSWGPPRNLSSR